MITRQKTDHLKFALTPLIKAASVPEDSTMPVVIYSQAEGNSFIEAKAYASKGIYKKIKTGQSRHPHMRGGLLGVSRFSYIVRFEEKKHNEKSVISHIHAYPHNFYLGCDWEQEIGRKVDDNEAVVWFGDDGTIEVWAFPLALRRDLESFIKQLEKLDTIDYDTEVNLTNSGYTVQVIEGKLATFQCKKKNPVR